MCGSYISFVTALLVVNLGLRSPVAWIAPTLVGAPFIARGNARIAGWAAAGEAQSGEAAAL